MALEVFHSILKSIMYALQMMSQQYAKRSGIKANVDDKCVLPNVRILQVLKSWQNFPTIVQLQALQDKASLRKERLRMFAPHTQSHSGIYCAKRNWIEWDQYPVVLFEMPSVETA